MRMLPAAWGTASATGTTDVPGLNPFTCVAARHLVPLASRWRITPPGAKCSSGVAATPFPRLDSHQLVSHQLLSAHSPPSPRYPLTSPLFRPPRQQWSRQSEIQSWLQNSVQGTLLWLRLGQPNRSLHWDSQEQAHRFWQGFWQALPLGWLNRDLHGYGHGLRQAKPHAPGQ
jgi:hypothetical protein